MSNAMNEGMLRRDPGASAQPGSREAVHAQKRSREEADATKREAAKAASSVKAQASELKQAVSAEAGKVATEARQSATDAAQRLRSEGVAIFSRQKNVAAEELTHLRDALIAASNKLSEEDDRRIADVAHIAADRVSAAAEYLRDRDLNRLASDVAQTARRRPVLFYGGLFAAGLAASRFLKASSHRSNVSG